MNKKSFTTHQLSKICDVSVSTIIGWIEHGKLPAYKTLGGHRRVKTKDLMEFLINNKMPVPENIEKYMPGNTKILVVDDEPFILESIGNMLKANKEYKIFKAADGFIAGQLVIEIQPNIVILDIMLPGIDGFNVCSQIKAKYSGIKVIAITGNTAGGFKERIMKCGADVFLAKPFDQEQLLESIKAVLKNDYEK